jgi:class 3 adenylate cyclase
MSTEQHQLAAILFTDIVGYTALMQRDEDRAMILIRRYHEVLDTCVGNHNGKVANNYGDGSLCIFPSALNAMNAAIGIQIGLRQEPVVPLRIGLHIGEVFSRREEFWNG